MLRKYIIYTYMCRHHPKKYVKFLYKKFYGKELDIDNPKNLNEWINWAKFHSDTSRWSELSDKYNVRRYIKECGLENMLVELYGVWDNVESIDWEHLPKEFILKTNHASGTNLIVRDKDVIDKGRYCYMLKEWLKIEYGDRFAEHHYKQIKPLIIAEKLLNCKKQDIETNSLIDYKFFCANGKPLCIFAIWCRDESSFKCAVYDLDWTYKPNAIRYNSHYIKPDVLLPAPSSLRQMIESVEILSKGFPLVRVDLYNVDNKPYFGEMTFTSAGGFIDYFTNDFLLELGDKCAIENSINKNLPLN